MYISLDTPKETHRQDDARFYRENYSLLGDVNLHLQPEQQTKLDEWKEFQTWWRSQEPLRLKLAGAKARIEHAQHQLDSAKKRLEAAELDDSKSEVGGQ